MTDFDRMGHAHVMHLARNGDPDAKAYLEQATARVGGQVQAIKAAVDAIPALAAALARDAESRLS